MDASGFRRLSIASARSEQTPPEWLGRFRLATFCAGPQHRRSTHYGVKKRSASREKSVLDGIRSDLGPGFVREVDGDALGIWYENLTTVSGLSLGTAARYFNVMHHN